MLQQDYPTRPSTPSGKFRQALLGLAALGAIVLVTTAESCSGGGAECAQALSMINGQCNISKGSSGLDDAAFNAMVDQCAKAQQQWDANCRVW